VDHPGAGAAIPQRRGSGFVYLSSVSSEFGSLIRRLCAEPAFGTVSLVSGPHDVMVDCFAATYEELMQVVTGTFADLPGVNSRDVVFVSRLFRHGSQWRSWSLEPARARIMTEQAAPPSPTYAPDRVDSSLLAELARDGRATWAELGAAGGVSAQTARRRVERFLSSGYVTMRCDTALAVQQGLREVNLGLNVPAPQVESIGQYFAGLSSCRMSAQVLGTQNLTVTLWVRDYLEIQRHEEALAAKAPGSTVVSRQVVVRAYKRIGHLLDESGRRRGYVPMPLWRDVA
jgi:DNA-binding Lrp family transcriptional regulator